MTDETPFRPRRMPLPAKVAFAAALLVVAALLVGAIMWVLF